MRRQSSPFWLTGAVEPEYEDDGDVELDDMIGEEEEMIALDEEDEDEADDEELMDDEGEDGEDDDDLNVALELKVMAWLPVRRSAPILPPCRS